MSELTLRRMVEESREVAGRVCSDWECKFLDSVYRQIEAGRFMSPKQRQTIEKIYAKVCASPY